MRFEWSIITLTKVRSDAGCCGHLLVTPDKKPKRSNQCTELAADLHVHYGILLTTSTHALKFCYQVMRVVLIAEMRVQVAEMRLVLVAETTGG